MIDVKKFISRMKKKPRAQTIETSSFYPCWKYHAVMKPRIVNSAQEEIELGPGWENSPAYFDKKAKT
jgi:hypothetical protein